MTQQEIIKAFMKSLDTTSKKGEAALNAAIKACSPFKSFKAAKAAMISDCKKAKSADDFLKTYCGIDYSTKDTGAITGKDAGGSKTKTDASIIPESGSLKNFTGNSFKVNDLTVKLSGKTFSKLTAAQQFIWQGLYTWWIKNSLDLISKSYGDNFSFTNNSSATTKTLNVAFFYKSNSTTAYTSSDFDSAGKTYRTTLNINMYHWNSLKNNLSKANSNFDHFIVAHELTHAVMHANIDANVFKTLPAFVTEGIAELTHGIENTRETAIKTLAKNSSLLSKALVLNTNSVVVSGVSNPTYAGGYMFFRYLARQAGDLTIENKTANKTIRTFYGNDVLKGGSGKESLWGGAGDNSLWGGGGNDTFIFQAGDGDDKIFDYQSGDMLKILKADGSSGGKFTKSKYSDGTLSLTISGGGSILFDNVSTTTTFNINNKSYKISGSKLARK